MQVVLQPLINLNEPQTYDRKVLILITFCMASEAERLSRQIYIVKVSIFHFQFKIDIFITTTQQELIQCPLCPAH